MNCGVHSQVHWDKSLLQFIATNIHDIITVHDLEGYCRYISPAVESLLGFSPEEIIGTRVFDYNLPDEGPSLQQYINRAKAGLPVTKTRWEQQYRRKDGSYCWLESETCRLYDPAGNLAEFLVISRDINARKQLEHKLHESCEQLALAIDGAKAGVWGFKPSGECQVRQWWAVLGYEQAEVASTDKCWLRLCHPEDRKRIATARDQCSAQPTAEFELECRIRHKDGNYRWVLANGRKFAEAGGSSPHWVGLITDITDFKHGEALKRESERRLRGFAQAIPDISVILDENGRYVEVFGRNEQFLSRPRKELKGRSVYQGLLSRHADFLLHRVRRTIRTRQPQSFCLEIMSREGCRFADVRMAPMNYLADGKKTVAVVFTDVSEKRYTERLMKFTLALRLRSRFMDDIIKGKNLDASMVAKAGAFGIDLSRPLFCCMIHLKNGGGDSTADCYTRAPSRIIRLLSEERPWFAWDCHDDIGIIVPSEDGEKGLGKDRRVAKRILEVIAAYDPQFEVEIGVGDRLQGLEGIRKSYRQAVSAALVAGSQEGQKICHFRDIGINRFLTEFSGEEQAKEYVQETIGKLLEYDRFKGSDLLHSLDVILGTASLKEAAQKLFFHYNTAILHKCRIESILSVSLGDVETRLALAAAVKLHKLALTSQKS